jgi:hypothetical protein
MRKLIITLALALACALPTVAIAAGAKLRLQPNPIGAGEVLKISGNVDGGCAKGDDVIIYSRAFPHRSEFAGVPAVTTTVRGHGRFTKHVRIPSSRAPGKYSVGARCGGGNFAHKTLRVVG